MTAQNRGWGAPKPYGHPDVVGMSVSGVDFPAGVHRRAKPIMVHVALRWEATIEPLVDPGCWGHAYRRIRGSDAWSNHAWGMAIDVNAPQHPMGSDTMSGSDERAAHDIANSLGCRWGGDYSGRLDQMHTEFMGTPTEADHIAANLNNDIGKRETVGEDMITRGDKGQIVEQWQQALQRYFWYQGIEALPDFGADGGYGKETVDWTNKWAGEVGLAHGMVTPMHWVVMGMSLHRRDDPATVVKEGQHVVRDDRSLMDFAWIQRLDTMKLLKQISSIASGVGVEVDEEAIAERVIRALDPSGIAAIVTNNLSHSVANNVVDELNRRLGNEN